MRRPAGRTIFARMLRRTLLVSALSALSALPGGSALAQSRARPAAAPALSPADQAQVAKAQAYLQGLRYARGRFTQTDPNGAVSSGTLYLSRPGKIRFEYDPARPLLVVSDGNNVKIYDKALKTFDQYPLGSTPLSLFLSHEIRLDRGVVVERVEPVPGGFALTARDGRKRAEGRIRLVFGDAPMALREWTVTDARGRRTRVQFSGVTEVASLDPALFVLRDPTRRPSGRP